MELRQLSACPSALREGAAGPCVGQRGQLRLPVVCHLRDRGLQVEPSTEWWRARVHTSEKSRHRVCTTPRWTAVRIYPG
jgi:hypothetical protein